MKKWIFIVLLICFYLNLFVPTSFPLSFNGAPLIKRAEAFLFIFSVGVILIYLCSCFCSFGSSSNADANPKKKKSTKIDYLIYLHLFLGLLLLVIRLSYPLSNKFRVCFELPEVISSKALFSPNSKNYQESCSFSVEWPFASQNKGESFSRYEDELTYSEAFRPSWRLGILNDILFNVYYGQPKENLPAYNREMFRKRDANPFHAKFTFPPNIHNYFATTQELPLKLDYRGSVAVYDSSGQLLAKGEEWNQSKLAELKFKVSVLELAKIEIDYSNYKCEQSESECLQRMSMSTLTQNESQLKISYLDSFDYREFTLKNLMSIKARPLVKVVRLLEKTFYALFLFYIILVLLPLRRSLAWKTLPLREMAFALLPLFPIGSVLYFLTVTTIVPHPLFEHIYYKIVGCTLFIFSPLFFPKVREFLKRIPSFSLILYPSLLLYSWYMWITLILMPSYNQMVLFHPGDDNLTYSSMGKAFLDVMEACVCFGLAFTKPFYPYLRALAYLIFGDGENYFQIFMAMLALLPCALLPMVLLTTLLNSNFEKQKIAHQLAVVFMISIAVIMFYTQYLSYGLTWIMFLFSEGVSWIIIVYAMMLLLPLATNLKRMDKPLLLIGIVAALMVASRTNTLSLLLFFLGALTLLSSSLKEFVKNSSKIVIPVVIAVVVIFLHSLLGIGVYNTLGKYISLNSSVNVDNPSFWAIFQAKNSFFPDNPSIVITILAVLFLGYLLCFLAKKARVQLISAALFCYLGGFLLQILFLDNAYYPRTIISSFFFLEFFIIFVALWCVNKIRGTDGSAKC
ncbi:MAG: hypothetical protein HQK50_17875 [Oligoflexia bacterium]|nr:hypothetical protein [Oligoflexia bacterium]MBF0367447.1 hypothetical protein [Oligoflexia bacterium]